MALYQKGKDTKDKILEVSKKLFYENGYTNTSCKHICKEADVNLGLIHYYFKTKKNIASIIYTQFLVQVKKYVKNIMTYKFDNYELKYATAVENWIYYNLFLSNEKYRKFFYEICKGNLLIDENTNIIESFYQLHVNTYNLNINTNEIKLIRVSSAALNMGLVEKYVENYFDMTIDELSEYKIRNVFRFMKLSESQIDDIVSESYKIYKKIDVKIMDYFKLSDNIETY